MTAYDDELSRYIARRLVERVERGSRANALDRLTEAVRARLAQIGRADVVFVCTHNSRRSHLGQVWMAVAARHFGCAGVTTYSAGTEVTAFAPKAVDALRRAGLEVFIEHDTPHVASNPMYDVFAHGERVARCHSKKLGDPSLPRGGFIAVMMCSDAAEACPVVHGATLRIALPYEDPKRADGTDREERAYDEACKTIAREMLCVVSAVVEW
ncbi:MAG: protein-tyrosine-phosphatase [Planctomycetes bacterium]|nr:protein-tyrosine-phosphatase [Planctomycetota bacterium]MCB9919570.1 protein-tyrosine-phosphatase [Planctomycetota bacterium]